MVDLAQHLRQVVFPGVVGDIERDVTHPGSELVPHVLPKLVAGVVLHRLLHPLAELVIGLLAARRADDREMVGQQPAERERIERRHQLPRGEIAGGAEDHEHARLGPPPDLKALEQRVALDRDHLTSRMRWPPN